MTQQEIEALIDRKAQEISDKRVAGLMSSYDKKFAETQKEMSRLRKQALGEDDGPDPEDSDTARENAQLKRQLAIIEASQRFPKAGPLYQRLMGFETAEEQIEFLEGMFATPEPAPAAPPPSPAPQPDVDFEVPDVDMNRPARGLDDFTMVDGVKMNDTIAKRIFESITKWPGT